MKILLRIKSLIVAIPTAYIFRNYI